MDNTVKRKLTGRCPKCDVRYVWPAHKCRLRDAGCPKCGTRLWATTHMFKRGPTREIECPKVLPDTRVFVICNEAGKSCSTVCRHSQKHVQSFFCQHEHTCGGRNVICIEVKKEDVPNGKKDETNGR